MKKILLLALVLAGMVGTASAQRETTGTIRVAFTDPTRTWTQSHFYIYVFGTTTDNNDSWPGVDVTDNQLTINGATYYYRDFPISTYGTGFKVIAVNDDGNAGSRSQSVNLTWCYDRSSITGDTYYSLISDWDGDNNRKAELKEVYYIADFENSENIKLIDQDGTNYSVKFSSTDFPKFVVANSYAFKDDGTLDFSKNNSYPENIYRPENLKTLDFTNLSQKITNEGTDGKDVNFDRWWKDGYWDASGIPDVNIDLSFNLSNWRPVYDSYFEISPSFTRTITSVGIATFSSQYAVTIPSGITASYVNGATNNVLNTVSFDGVIPANTGALIMGDADEYTFTPGTTDVSVSDSWLVHVINGETINQEKDEPIKYILTTNKVENGPARFYMVNVTDGNYISAGHAYLINKDETYGGPGTAREYFNIWDESNSIEAVAQEQHFDGQVYNLAGQRVAQPTKGLYIVNGKKVIKK